MFGIYALLDGALAFVSAVREPGVRSSWWLALIGISGILLGTIALLWPDLSTHAFAGCIAVWAIVVGLCEIAGGMDLRKLVPQSWCCILSGAVAIIFGYMLMSRPDEGTLALVRLIGGFAIVFGIVQVAAAYQLRKHIVSNTESVFLSD